MSFGQSFFEFIDVYNGVRSDDAVNIFGLRTNIVSAIVFSLY